MKGNKFSEVGAKLNDKDIKALETKLSFKFPIEFVNHYLKYNGGIPDKGYFIRKDLYEPAEVASFKEISNTEKNYEGSLLYTYELMLKKNVLPKKYLPFANDWGGNFFCLNLENNNIIYFTTDSFDSDLTLEENQIYSTHILCDNFETFLSNLVSEDEAYSDEEG